jgi:DNA-binding GntR family transcriptional regulator
MVSCALNASPHDSMQTLEAPRRGVKPPPLRPRERAYADIKRGILQGDFPAGQMVSLRELSLRVRCPLAGVRDAVIRLECERLLRVHPQRGIQVMEVDLEFVREAYQLRLMIELEGVRRTLEAPDAGALQALAQRTAASIRELEAGGDAAALARAVEADWALHALIVDSVQSRLLCDIYRQNRERQRLIGRAYAFHPAKYARAALQEHEPIIAALAARDAARAAALLEAHITAAMRRQIGI